MRVGSLFTGIGGFDLGFERAGMDVAYSVEFDAKCRGVLSRHWPTVTQHTDVRSFDGAAVPVDVLCGGFPCQDLSVAGRRAGLAGERSGLFFEFARIIGEAQPQWVVIENVPGLLSSAGGRDMGTVVGALADLGYGVAWRVLDAQYFGVAQRRRRVFIVGCAGDAAGAAQVLLEPEGVRRDSPPSREAGSAVAALSASGVGTCGADDNLAYSLMAQRGQRNDPTDQTFLPVAFHMTQSPISGPISPALSKGTEHGCATIAAHTELGVRRLTPTECERLQGFPDGWTAGQADSSRYRQLGNAVAVPVIEWLGRRIACA